MTLTCEIVDRARALGFDRVAVVPVSRPAHAAAFEQWLRAGYHGEMGYLETRAELRTDPALLAPGARSLIVVAANYNPRPYPAPPVGPSRGSIARYAQSQDYHDVIKRRLFALDAFVRSRTARSVPGKAWVDTAPLLERDFAGLAGLGFAGRNTCLIIPGLGSWTFLAALAVPEVLEVRLIEGAVQEAEGRGARRAWTCGRCTRCLDACPTRAFVAPRVMDARRCISYLTIELRGSIPLELRPLVGNWVFGCDVCQEVCPYNRAAPAAVSLDERRSDLGLDATGSLSLLEMLVLDDVAFRARFGGTPVMRARRRGLVRNACLAAGNWGDQAAVPALVNLLGDGEPLLRGHAAWALGRIGGDVARKALDRAFHVEVALAVREEIWQARML